LYNSSEQEPSIKNNEGLTALQIGAMKAKDTKILQYLIHIGADKNVKTTFKENITVGDIEFTSEDSGSLNVDVNWSKVAPYLGLGFGRAVPNKRWGFAADFGTYFSSSPEITLDATGIIERSKDQEALLNESFKSFKFIPYASLRVSYSF
jgi:hypothetical protein